MEIALHALYWAPLIYHYLHQFQAAKIAVQRGWAINLGGGFHHCSANRGGGFCAYADINFGNTLPARQGHYKQSYDPRLGRTPGELGHL